MSNYATFLLLASEALYIAGGVAGGLLVGILASLLLTKILRANKLSTTERLVAEMKANAENECKALKKEAIVEVKEQELKLRNELERETKE